MAFSMVDSNNSMREEPNVKCYRKVAPASKSNNKMNKNSLKPNDTNLENVKIVEDCNKCINQSRLNNIEDIISTNHHDTENNHINSHNCNEGTTSLRSINLSGCWSITDYGLRWELKFKDKAIFQIF
jgi:hypothetical protein